MNYLAHAYLSFHKPGILVGNMISDFVKGKKQYEYPLEIQHGIRLHREIDTFTDLHPATKEAKQYLKPAAGAYAGAFMDVVYDHFLALDEQELSPPQWKDFSKEVYAQLADSISVLPEKFAFMLPYMSTQDWLYNYRFTAGIEKSFGGVARRAKYIADSHPVFLLFEKHYEELRKSYTAFFPDVKKMAELWMAERLKG